MYYYKVKLTGYIGLKALHDFYFTFLKLPIYNIICYYLKHIEVSAVKRMNKNSKLILP